MKHTVMERVQAGMNQTAWAGLPRLVATWDSMAAMTGMGQKDKPYPIDNIYRDGQYTVDWGIMESEYTDTYDEPGLGGDYRLQVIDIDLGRFFCLADIISLLQRGWLAIARLLVVVHVAQQKAKLREEQGGGEVSGRFRAAGGRFRNIWEYRDAGAGGRSMSGSGEKYSVSSGLVEMQCWRGGRAGTVAELTAW